MSEVLRLEDDEIFTFSYASENVAEESVDGINVEDITPENIVRELDKYVIGQADAKRKVANAIRNRWRRNKVPSPLRDDISPKNILMVGPTGVGKTEIARRLAAFINAPFIKVEATKFTEIGYVGRDVDSIVRELLDNAIIQLKERKRAFVHAKAKESAKQILLTALIGKDDLARNEFSSKLENGELDDFEVEINVKSAPPQANMFPGDMQGGAGGFGVAINISDMFEKVIGGGSKSKKRKMKVRDAFRVLINEESDKLFDEDEIIKTAMFLTANYGIVFLDEVDKICGTRAGNRSEVNREGVQRDLLPLLEGTTVSTKYGPIKTDYILFIASGAFHYSSPSDLLPEFQARLPVRVELSSIDLESMISILKNIESSLLKQYCALLQAEGVVLKFKNSAIRRIAEFAIKVNKEVENIGARRLHTIMERLLDEISFSASENGGKEFVIDADYVDSTLKDLMNKIDLLKFIL